MSSNTKRGVVALASAAAILSALAPAASAEPAVAVSSGASPNLIKFDTASPTTTTVTPIVGLAASTERVVGLDYRPATGEVFAFSSTGTLYVIDPDSGVAVRRSRPGSLSGGSQGAAAFGVDFNPVVDRLRLNNDVANGNGRVNVDTGALINDTKLAYAVGDDNEGKDPNVTAAAYTNNFAGAGATVLYTLDSTLDVLATQAPPNDGKLNTIGSLGVPFTTFNGFDISPTTGVAFAGLSSSVSSSFYRIDLGTGRATLVGPIGGGQRVAGLTILRAPAVPTAT